MTAEQPGSNPSSLRRRLLWIGLAIVVIVALAFGSGAGRGRTLDDRVMSIAETIKCPQCSGQSAATSEATSAVAIRKDIASRLRAGQNPDEIRDFYGSRYDSLLLNPSRSGAGSLVWILPVVMMVATFGGLAVALTRSRRSAPAAASAADRELVAAARTAPPDGHGEGSGR